MHAGERIRVGGTAELAGYTLRLHEARQPLHVAMRVGTVAFALNIPLAWCLVTGEAGLPALGGAGCGIATALLFWVMFALLWLLFALFGRLASARQFLRGV